MAATEACRGQNKVEVELLQLGQLWPAPWSGSGWLNLASQLLMRSQRARVRLLPAPVGCSAQERHAPLSHKAAVVSGGTGAATQGLVEWSGGPTSLKRGLARKKPSGSDCVCSNRPEGSHDCCDWHGRAAAALRMRLAQAAWVLQTTVAIGLAVAAPSSLPHRPCLANATYECTHMWERVIQWRHQALHEKSGILHLRAAACFPGQRPCAFSTSGYQLYAFAP